MNIIRKNLYVPFIALAVLFILAGCQAVPTLQGPDLYLVKAPRPPQEPPADIQRTAEMSLVAAIPGLNVPFAPTGSFQFGDLTEMLDAEDIPSFIIGYDDKVHPLTEVADLFSEQYSIATTRILPSLTHAVEIENEIREKQGVPPLKELDIVSYSQGSVLAADLVLRLIRYRLEFDSMKQAGDGEWGSLANDPELKIFSEVVEDYLFLKNIRVQRQKQFDKDYDFREFYDRLVSRLARNYQRFRTYLTDPKKIYPDSPIRSGKKKGYPRRYPKTLKWFEEHFPADDPADSINLDYWMKYFEYETLIPLSIRFFSMSGSFFGSPMADTTYGMLQFLPVGVDKFFVGPATEQIKQTRLGSRHHLELVEELLDYTQRTGAAKELLNTYFIVGANGEKGDGIVDQSSAHFSSHILTRVRAEDLLGDESEDMMEFEYRQLPVFRVTGLKVHHVPGTKFFIFRHPGVAQMSETSVVYPFLLAFLRKDYDSLDALHDEHNQKLRQFMVELDLPYTKELQGYDFSLRPGDPDIKITGRFHNKTANTIVWTGVFKSKKHFYDFETTEPPKYAKVVLRAFKHFGKMKEVSLVVTPGTNHFVQVTSDQEEKRGLFDLGIPSIFQFTPRNALLGMMQGER